MRSFFGSSFLPWSTIWSYLSFCSSSCWFSISFCYLTISSSSFFFSCSLKLQRSPWNLCEKFSFENFSRSLICWIWFVSKACLTRGYSTIPSRNRCFIKWNDKSTYTWDLAWWRETRCALTRFWTRLISFSRLVTGGLCICYLMNFLNTFINCFLSNELMRSPSFLKLRHSLKAAERSKVSKF
jgi:hypothetical protein